MNIENEKDAHHRNNERQLYIKPMHIQENIKSKTREGSIDKKFSESRLIVRGLSIMTLAWGAIFQAYYNFINLCKKKIVEKFCFEKNRRCSKLTFLRLG